MPFDHFSVDWSGNVAHLNGNQSTTQFEFCSDVEFFNRKLCRMSLCHSWFNFYYFFGSIIWSKLEIISISLLYAFEFHYYFVFLSRNIKKSWTFQLKSVTQFLLLFYFHFTIISHVRRTIFYGPLFSRHLSIH